jgi:hypothetical protein
MVKTEHFSRISEKVEVEELVGSVNMVGLL